MGQMVILEGQMVIQKGCPNTCYGFPTMEIHVGQTVILVGKMVILEGQMVIQQGCPSTCYGFSNVKICHGNP